MIFDKLFSQYRDPRKLLFGSRWLDWHGRFFLGSPETHGLDVRQDLRHSYYFVPTDRLPPTDTKALEEWKRQSILIAAYRDITDRRVAKSSFFAAMVLISGLVVVGAGLRGTKIGAGKVSEWWQTSSFTSSGGKSAESDAVDCTRLRDEMETGEQAVSQEQLRAATAMCEAAKNTTRED